MASQSCVKAMLLLALGAGAAPNAAAVLQDLGPETLDTSTNLLWLDLDLTDGSSPNAALANFPQYRWATDDEVYALFLDGGMTAVDDVNRSADYADALNLISLLGATFTSTNQLGTQGWALYSDSPSFAEPFVAARTDLAQGRAYPGLGGFGPTSAFNDVGVFLVRSVPEPGSLALVGGALMGLGLGSVRRSRGQ
jgi:PEP-CTERM motif-containing protein